MLAVVHPRRDNSATYAFGVVMIETYELHVPKHCINLEHELSRLRFASDAQLPYPFIHDFVHT